MFDEKRYFGTQYPSDFSLSGVYPIVIEQTNAVIKNNKVDGNRTITSNYNSKVIVENLTSFNNEPVAKAFKNCWISYKDSNDNLVYDRNYIIFPKPIFSDDPAKRSGGITAFQNTSGTEQTDNRPHRGSEVYNKNAAEWSTHLTSNNSGKILWQENGKNSFFYKSGEFNWHITKTEYAKNSVSGFCYEPISTIDSINKYFPDINGNTIDLYTYHGKIVDSSNITFSNIKGQLNLHTGQQTGNSITFENATRLNLDLFINRTNIIASNAIFNVRAGVIKDAITASYVNYNTFTANISNQCIVSFVTVYDLLNDKAERFSMQSGNSSNDSKYYDNFFVRSADYIQSFINGYQTQLIYITGSYNILINNAVKYSLIRHSHKNIFNYDETGNIDVDGIILKSDDVIDELSDTSDALGNRSITAGFNYETDAKVGLRRTTFNPIPIGTVMGWYQVDGKPEVPYGFYDLTSESEFYANGKIKIYVDSDDPTSNSYNVDFMSLYENKGVFDNGYIEFEPQQIINTGNVKILTIIKFNNNVIFRK